MSDEQPQKFHINDDLQIMPCNAQKKCQFGGRTGNENHFTDEKEAEKVAQKMLIEKYGVYGGAKRTSNRKPTSTSIRKMKSVGANVRYVGSLKNHNFANDDFSVSNVDLIEEKPDEALLGSIRSGEFTFKL